MKEFLKAYLEEMNIPCSEAQLAQFELYHELLAEWNEKINLTAIREPQEVALKHFADCAYAAALIPQGASLIDIGSGAGFPGVPLKILRPDLQVLLLDSLNKRILFLEELIRSLRLDGIRALHSRAEDGAKKELREQFDVATARAVANLSVLSEYCLPYVKVGGLFLAYKGSSGQEELSDAKNAIATLGGTIEQLAEYCLPSSDMKRSLAVIRKKKTTPKIYPRQPAKIAKAPL